MEVGCALFSSFFFFWGLSLLGEWRSCCRERKNCFRQQPLWLKRENCLSRQKNKLATQLLVDGLAGVGGCNNSGVLIRMNGCCIAVAKLKDFGSLRRYRDQRDRPDLSNPESLQLYLETRFEQLRVPSSSCSSFLL